MTSLQTISNSSIQLLATVLLSALLSTHSINLHAQSEGDLVYADMYNNQQFVGTIVSQNEEIIRLSLDGVNDTLSLDRSMIQGINSTKNKRLFNNGRYHNTSGRMYGLGLSVGQTDEHVYNIIELVSYEILNERVGLGGGGGVRLYHNDNSRFRNLNFGDLFGYGKLNLTNKRRRIFVDTKLGYAVPLKSFDYVGDRVDGEEILFRSEYSSGFVAQPGIGIEFATQEKLKYTIKINMVFQNTRVQRGPINTSEFTTSRRSSNIVQDLNFASIHFGLYL